MSTPAYHTGWPSQSLGELLPVPDKHQNLHGGLFWKLIQVISLLFNLPSTVKPPPRKKILCTNQNWKFHSWNLFQTSATSIFLIEKKNLYIIHIAWCHSVSVLHIEALDTTLKRCVGNLSLALLQIKTTNWIRSENTREDGWIVVGCFLFKDIFFYGGRNFLKRLLFGCPNLFEI